MGKPYKNGLIVGRFQILHKGHENMIRQALALCERVIVLIGSVQEAGTIRNPFDYYTRRISFEEIFANELLLKTIDILPLRDLSGENDISPEWGRWVLNACPIRPDIMIYGNDETRKGWFNKELTKDISELIVARKDNISTTKILDAIRDNKYEEVLEYTNMDMEYAFEVLREILKEK